MCDDLWKWWKIENKEMNDFEYKPKDQNITKGQDSRNQTVLS